MTTTALSKLGTRLVSASVSTAPDIDGLFAIETDGYGSGNLSPNGVAVKDHFKATVDAEAGKTYKITFNYASRTDWADLPSDSDGFDILWNGVAVGHFNPDPTHVGWNTAEITVTGVSGNDVFEIVELGANDSYGAIIDNIRVTGEMCGDPEVTPQCHPELLAELGLRKGRHRSGRVQPECCERPRWLDQPR